MDGAGEPEDLMDTSVVHVVEIERERPATHGSLPVGAAQRLPFRSRADELSREMVIRCCTPANPRVTQ